MRAGMPTPPGAKCVSAERGRSSQPPAPQPSVGVNPPPRTDFPLRFRKSGREGQREENIDVTETH